MVTNKPVPHGYKQTEVGVIPQDWQVDSLKRFWVVTDCKHITAEFVSNGISVASIREVQSYFVELKNAKQTTELYYLELIEGGRKPQPGDLIFSRNATVGEVAQVCVWHPPFAMGQDVCLLRKKDPNFSSDYLQEVIRSPVVIEQLANLMVGSTFKRVNIEQIRNLAVPMPLPEEQRVIAQSLSDVDALITECDRIITKKRNTKQGTMQELLTGKKRLPGFSGEWEVKKLGEIGEFKNGINKGKEDFGFGYPFVNLLDVFGRSKIFQGVSFGLVNSSGAERKIYELRKGDILFIRSSVKPEGVGLTSVVNDDLEDTVYSGFLIRFRDFGELDFEYKVHCFNEEEFRKRVIDSSTVSANTNINQDALKNLQITLPPTIEEQKAIAQILSDMNTEIAALEQKRDKYKAIKQGMMQELLTGKTRLIGSY
ncbi:restriction endonuclease subunit S [Nostoc sp. 'Peltigera membranacea cyanobiont' 232]|uniref:restriction endonuclease subunit S n=1 Tax=Nostoc sp. 'Peltigera membranacea cyanobiont' 232 TaxID=2014531 RepID=UPI001679354C|nr:restriction endonuclease subunit S [Nostoc sp. 'Peltigera membranacea cyanobiont' 232]